MSQDSTYKRPKILTEKDLMLSRRQVLRLGVGLPLCTSSLFFPLSALAGDFLPPRKPSFSERALSSLNKNTSPSSQQPTTSSEPTSKYIPNSDPSDLPPRKPSSPRLVMLDPGHGGRDPGALGRRGTREKNITLDIARRIASDLSKHSDIRVEMTRTSDVYIPLKDRVSMSQKAHADLFVSIHADSAPNRQARGLSVYTLSEKASDAFARQLADQENRFDMISGMDLSDTERDVAEILLDLTTRRTRNIAQRLKVNFVNGMGRNWHLLENPMRSANFAVLRSAEVPSMLVETGFLSNSQDESVLRQPQYREKIARLMANEMTGLLRSSLFG